MIFPPSLQAKGSSVESRSCGQMAKRQKMRICDLINMSLVPVPPLFGGNRRPFMPTMTRWTILSRRTISCPRWTQKERREKGDGGGGGGLRDGEMEDAGGPLGKHARSVPVISLGWGWRGQWAARARQPLLLSQVLAVLSSPCSWLFWRPWWCQYSNWTELRDHGGLHTSALHSLQEVLLAPRSVHAQPILATVCFQHWPVFHIISLGSMSCWAFQSAYSVVNTGSLWWKYFQLVFAFSFIQVPSGKPETDFCARTWGWTWRSSQWLPAGPGYCRGEVGVTP